MNRATLNWRVLSYAAFVALLVGLAAAVVPALAAATEHPHRVLQGSVGATRSKASTHFKELLVAFEAALALVCVVTAGLLINSFVRLSRAEWGFRSEHLTVAHVKLPKDMWLYQKDGPAGGRMLTATGKAMQLEFASGVISRLADIPAVESATTARDFPLERGEWAYRPLSSNGRLLEGRWPLVQVVGPEYFRTLGAVIEGREFEPATIGSLPKL